MKIYKITTKDMVLYSILTAISSIFITGGIIALFANEWWSLYLILNFTGIQVIGILEFLHWRIK